MLSISKSKILPILYILSLVMLSGCDSNNNPSNTTEEDDTITSGLDSRPDNTTCLAASRPSASGDLISYERAFPNLSFNQPVALIQPPDNFDRWYVVEKPGTVYSIANIDDTTEKSVYLDLSNKVDDRSEGGLLSIAFHPDFDQNGFVFVYYTTSDDPANSGTNFRSHISRFTVNADGGSLDSASELLLLNVDQPYGNHDGGNIAFGPDGDLYIGLGDGGSGDDPTGNGQNKDTLLGAMLRIDVNVTQQEIDAGTLYKIPPDNPFAASSGCGSGNGCPELFAWGLRNPWRWSFDRLTDALWAGDVGQGQWEEIDRVELGKNYGWRCYEGNHEHLTSGCDLQAEYVFPVAEYEHPNGAGRSVTGGFVYRGSAIPDATGVYLFGDFSTGRVWDLSDPYGNADMQVLFDSGLPVSSFAQGHDGEIYIVSYSGGIYRLIPGTGTTGTAFAENLSATGCADPNDPKKAAAGMIPYDINSPLWSDGATKHRWFALPNGETISIGENGDWDFPIGSVLRKDFYLDDKIIETRLFAHHSDGGWAGYSYEWNDTQTEATLLPDGKLKMVGNQQWLYPSNADCLLCHTIAAGRTLGPETAQMNRTYFYDATERSANQLATYNKIGLFSQPLTDKPETLSALAMPQDENANIASRARAYLHINCSNCHRPGGSGRGAADFRYQVDFKEMNICNQSPETGDLGVSDARLLVPGDPDNSLISLRMKDLGDSRMPPLGTSVADSTGVAVIDAWISSISDCQ
jgi:uncharacterized repeat protein (TIGR03806 family)